MIHRRKGRKLKRTASHRKALLSNLSVALIKHKRIQTTEAKAKELRMYIEPLVTKAKNALQYKDANSEKGVHLRRVAESFLRDKEAVKILFDEIGAKTADRPGGYTRVLKLGQRLGDGAKTAIIEFVDFNIGETKRAELEQEEQDSKKKKGIRAKLKETVEEAKKEAERKTAKKSAAKKTTTRKKKEAKSE